MIRIPFAVLAAAVLAASPAFAQSQTSDRSGAISFAFGVAPFVEIVSHDPSLHNFTPLSPDGVTPGRGAIGTFNILQTNPPIREVLANTPYRISIDGLRDDGKLVFVNGQGDELVLSALCDHLSDPNPSTRTLTTLFNCQGSPVFPAAGRRWVLFHAFTPRKEDTQNAMAGVYTATVYIQIDAA